MLQKHPLIIALAMAQAATLSSSALADHKHDNTMEEVIVEELPVEKSEHIVDGGKLQHADTSEILKAIPGASVNRNGGLTGIAQFRGFYGDRIAVTIDSGQYCWRWPQCHGCSTVLCTSQPTERIER